MKIKENIEKKVEKEIKAPTKKEFVALKTTKITANGEFTLVAGEQVPNGISEPFLQSLLNSKIIKNK